MLPSTRLNNDRQQAIGNQHSAYPCYVHILQLAQMQLSPIKKKERRSAAIEIFDHFSPPSSPASSLSNHISILVCLRISTMQSIPARRAAQLAGPLRGAASGEGSTCFFFSSVTSQSIYLLRCTCFNFCTSYRKLYTKYRLELFAVVTCRVASLPVTI